MTVYAVFLNEPNEAAWKTLREKWPSGRSFILTNNLAFIAIAPEDLTLTTEVAEAVGINQSGDRAGLVFELAAHSGYNRSDLWEWLDKVRHT